ncbi:DNA-binding protein [Bacterioplanoides pacificum]|uniref:DNA-binding protein n=1 Tax=Bacterioplanoides pacificum TaxID=1171596 RepID=A0ABV7VRX1_9GAMM
MARGGINKVRVAKARQSLISQGKNPSIDAVRVALGNTGSKSTIHRYLKEIEEQEATQLDDEALLSQPIRELICRLASTLKQEAQQLVEEQQHQADQQQRKMQQQHHELEQQVTQLRDTLQQSEQRLADTEQQLLSVISARDHWQTEARQNHQQAEALQSLIEEKQNQIDSLEEKHRHNRDALQHYRQSVQTQRDQDLRQHEQQIQQLQAEIRTLNQTINLKQSDITELTKDNGRLLADSGNLQRQLDDARTQHSTCQQQLARQDHEFQQQLQQLTQLQLLNQQQQQQLALQQQREDESKESQQQLRLTIAALEAQLSAKDQLLERLLQGKTEPADADPGSGN